MNVCTTLQFALLLHLPCFQDFIFLQTCPGWGFSVRRKRPQFTSKWIAGLAGKDLEAEIAALTSEQMTALLTHLKPHLAAELLQVTHFTLQEMGRSSCLVCLHLLQPSTNAAIIHEKPASPT